MRATGSAFGGIRASEAIVTDDTSHAEVSPLGRKWMQTKLEAIQQNKLGIIGFWRVITPFDAKHILRHIRDCKRKAKLAVPFCSTHVGKALSFSLSWHPWFSLDRFNRGHKQGRFEKGVYYFILFYFIYYFICFFYNRPHSDFV